jgi:uncharacterized protein YdeI (YjbR/CyaY-like superfamily)
MHPVFFANQQEFRQWLEKNHQTQTELQVGYYKVDTGKPSLTWSESVDQALCFGWIDGVRKSLDKESYTIRFTPRNPRSTWSDVNINKVEELIKKGLMKPAGLTKYNKRQESRSRVYSYENPATELSESFAKELMKNKKAWNYYQSKTPSYRKVTARWVMSAKQEATRLKRLQNLIANCEQEQVIKEMSYGKKKA